MFLLFRPTCIIKHPLLIKKWVGDLHDLFVTSPLLLPSSLKENNDNTMFDSFETLFKHSALFYPDKNESWKRHT